MGGKFRAKTPPPLGKASDTTKPKALPISERHKAYEMYLNGYTRRQIALATGHNYDTIKKWVADASAEDAKTRAVEIAAQRRVQNERLEQLLAALAPAVSRGVVSAVTAAVQVHKRIAALNGLDAPIRVDVNPNAGDPVETALQEMINEAKAQTAAQEQQLRDGHAG